MVNSADWLHLDTFLRMRDDLPRCIRLLNTWKTGFAIKASQCSGHFYWIKAVLTGWTAILEKPVSTVCHCAGLRKCVFMVWSSNMARTLNCRHCEAIFPGVEETWFLAKHLPQVERCSGLVSQHCVPLQLDQKVCIHGLIQYKLARTLTFLHDETGFPGVEEPSGYW